MPDRWDRMSDDDQERFWSAAFWCRLELARLRRRHDAPPAYERLFAYAFFHRMLGMRLFRQVSGRRLPGRRWAEATRLARRGRDEILQFRGLTKDDPLRRVSRDGLSATLRLFRFDEVGRTLVDVGRPGATLVALRVRSVTHDAEFTLFARVSYPVVVTKLPERAGPPCPGCGHRLRTPRARQCGRCRLDWHDPANVFFRT